MMIATTIEQSKRLISAGLDPKGADMFYALFYLPFGDETEPYEIRLIITTDKCCPCKGDIPAWSLSALWQMVYELDRTYEFPTTMSADELIENLVKTIIYRKKH